MRRLKLATDNNESVQGLRSTTSQTEQVPQGLVYEVSTALSEDTYTLPLSPSGTYDFTVSWGDGSSDTITAHDDAAATHTYAEAGTYRITIRGLCTHHSMSNTHVDRDKIVRVLNCCPDGLAVIDWWGASQIQSFEHGCRNSATVTTFQNYARDCSSLENVTHTLFRNNTSVTVFRDAFLGCSFLSSIDGRLFEKNVSASNMQGVFFASGLTSIPEDLFANCPNIITVTNAFRLCPITTLPSDLLSNKPLLSNVTAMCLGCTSLQSVPSGLLDECPSLQFADGLFDGANHVNFTTLDGAFFNNCPQIQSFVNSWRNTRLSAATVDALLINISQTNTTSTPGAISYSPMTGSNQHLDSARSAAALTAISDLISAGWERQGTYS